MKSNNFDPTDKDAIFTDKMHKAMFIFDPPLSRDTALNGHGTRYKMRKYINRNYGGLGNSHSISQSSW